jgi:hypothetical protein
VGSKIIIQKIQCAHHLATQLALILLSLPNWGNVEGSLPMQHKSMQQQEDVAPPLRDRVSLPKLEIGISRTSRRLIVILAMQERERGENNGKTL